MNRLFYKLLTCRSLQHIKESCNNFKVLRTAINGLHTHNPSLQNIKNVYLVDEVNGIETEKINGCNKYTDRTYNCGELSIRNIGEEVTLCGWLEYQRLNKFLVIRDGYGETQLFLEDETINSLPYESIIKIKGKVMARPENMINKKQVTGQIEVLVSSLTVLNKAKEKLPFNIRGYQKANEALRMQYRYLDLRFPEMQRNLRVRSKFFMAMRNFLVNDCQFVEVETPTLFKATPGGAQEFIVPTRFPGQFFSLVQSPQQFKQILMAGAIDRYFQIARCYRDEGTRSDRQPEFTQLDIEMSFVEVDGVLQLVEEMLQECWPDFLTPLSLPFPRILYRDALETYGTDKPDLSYDFKIADYSNLINKEENEGFYCLKFPAPFNLLTNSIKDTFRDFQKYLPRTKLLQIKVTEKLSFKEKIENFLGRTLNNEDIVDTPVSTVVFLTLGDKMQALTLLGRIRVEFVNILEQNGIKVKNDGMHPLWVIDFPLFEKNSISGELQSAHHPFTAPNGDDLHLLDTDPLQVRAQAYDLVLNGNEVGGGSIRVHDPVQQESILDKLNIDKSTLKHMIEMLGSGCPPHGGIALGLDRLMATILNTSSIRDVIAFPKTFEGRDPLSGAPSAISDAEKKLYHIKTVDT